MEGCDEIMCNSVITVLGTEQAPASATILLFILYVFASMMMVLMMIRKLKVLPSNSWLPLSSFLAIYPQTPNQASLTYHKLACTCFIIGMNSKFCSASKATVIETKASCAPGIPRAQQY